LDRDLDGVSDELVDRVGLVRDGSFDGIYVGEHHVTDSHHYLSNEAVLAHVAEHVGDTSLGAGVCLLPFHNPVRVAEVGATLDVLSGGQFRLGVALGYRDKEFHAFDVPREEAPGRLIEGVEIIERLWTEDEVSYDGEYFTLEDVSINPKPLQEPRPKIIVGASNEHSVRRAARIADGWMGAHVPFDVAETQVNAFRDERDGTGKSPGHVGLTREAFVAETTEAAEQIVKEPLSKKYDSYSDWGQDDVISEDDFSSPWEKLKHERFLVGTPEEVVEDIRRYKTILNLDEIVLRTQFPGLAPDVVRDSIKLLSEEVIPRV
jgi:alkanesulfonate monooxygenase SsuD/methylene tetrahydromethanopterin reductase-like flavin-dependent oxidoreductase (luciferase family)